VNAKGLLPAPQSLAEGQAGDIMRRVGSNSSSGENLVDGFWREKYCDFGIQVDTKSEIIGLKGNHGKSYGLA
jgi:hypothetical protein